jgi:hypothetical protein
MSLLIKSSLNQRINIKPASPPEVIGDFFAVPTQKCANYRRSSACFYYIYPDMYSSNSAFAAFFIKRAR